MKRTKVQKKHASVSERDFFFGRNSLPGRMLQAKADAESLGGDGSSRFNKSKFTLKMPSRADLSYKLPVPHYSANPNFVQKPILF